jgi:hypothetical protein
MLDSILDICRTRLVKDKARYTLLVRGLLPLCGRLDATRAAGVADVILAILGDEEAMGHMNRGEIARTALAEVLVSVAERLDTPRALRVATELVRVLQKADKNRIGPDPLSGALMSVCRRLDADGAARIAEAIVAAVRDPTTAVEGRTPFASVLGALGNRLDPACGDSLERALVDSLVADLTRVKSLSWSSTALLCQSLAALSAHTSAKSAARVADALTETIRNPQTPIDLLGPLVKALVVVGGRLPPEDASSRTNGAIAVLDTLWSTRTVPLDRTILAEALAAAWTGVGPTEASAHARRMVADLEDLLRAPNLMPFELNRLARALALVYGRFDPAERSAHSNTLLVAQANTVLATLRDPKSKLSLGLLGQFADSLVVICMLLDRPEAVRVFDALLTIFSDPATQRFAPPTQRFQFHFQEESIRTFVSRLDEADLRRLLEHPLAVERLQRIVLDALGERKQRSFRNTWDYLDWTESH